MIIYFLFIYLFIYLFIIMTHLTPQYLNSFFGKRNNIFINPIPYRNFTEETLRYMTPKVRANEITNILFDFLYKIGIYNNIIIIDATAGIGGNILSFLDDYRIHKVIGYEILKERYDILKNNLSDYNFDKNRYEIFNEPFNINKLYVDFNTVVIIDPPWLPIDINGSFSSKDQYMLSGIIFSDFKLEHLLDKLRNHKFILFKLPLGYHLDFIQNYSIYKIELKKFLLIIAQPI